MRVLFVTSEVAPLIKTGGLADVSGALPVALRQLGDDVRILIPGYPQVLKALESFKVETFISGVALLPDSRLFSAQLPDGVPLFVLDCPALFHREGGIYLDNTGNDWPDNALRFGLLSRVAALLGSNDSPINWKPEVIHCNDWQSGLTPAYLHFLPGGAPTVMTIHNLAFQGVFPSETVAQLALPAESFHPHGAEFYGNLSFLKAGLYYANHVTTVSPTYAEEIQSDALGFGLQGLLKNRNKSLSGILNGIDEKEWNSETDQSLAQTYGVTNLTDKAANKSALQRKLNLKVDSDIPLFGLVSRFTFQKGLDIVLEVAPQLLQLPAQLVLLGSGDVTMQNNALALARKYPGQVGVVVGFDESLSHLIEAGVDMFLMPSRFEPCGLNQMYSQHYGTPPIVHATGGLVDSVVDCNKATLTDGSASGFVFNKMTSNEFFHCIQRAVKLYHDKKIWQTIQVNGMKKEFGWQKSAAKYHEIYQNLLIEK